LFFCIVLFFPLFVSVLEFLADRTSCSIW